MSAREIQHVKYTRPAVDQAWTAVEVDGQPVNRPATEIEAALRAEGWQSGIVYPRVFVGPDALTMDLTWFREISDS